MRLLYLLTIAVANIITAKFAPFVLCGGVIVVPVGSFLVGLTFIVRDIVQVKHGKKRTYSTILAALMLSAVMSIILGDTAYIAVASASSFFVSEAIDTEIFSRLRRSIIRRILWSGIFGCIADSALFVIVGLSPMGADMLTWNQVPFAIIGQAVVKTSVQAVAIVVNSTRLRRLEEERCKK